jgi:hypothetical protein
MVRTIQKWIHANDFDKKLFDAGWEIVDQDDEFFVLISKEV